MHDMETLSALVFLCGGKASATYGFPSQRAFNAVFSYMLWSTQIIEQTVDLTVDSGHTAVMSSCSCSMSGEKKLKLLALIILIASDPRFQ